jgi:histidine decarboxylase
MEVAMDNLTLNGAIIPPAQIKEIFQHKQQYFKQLSETFLGYPTDLEFDQEFVHQFTTFNLNNIGDPFAESSFLLNTHDFEVAAINYIVQLLQLDSELYWGYTTNGGTEGNVFGIHAGRTVFNEGIVYFSEDAHYSVSKGCNITRSEYVIIKSQQNGEFDYVDFAARLNKNRPAIIITTIGTTMKGAIDNNDKIKQILRENNVQYYIHTDCALNGLMLPFVADGLKLIADVDSLAISGHKFIGSFIPFGICLSKKSVVDKLSRYVEYVKIHDNTLSGSRNAIAPMILWHYFATNGLNGVQQEVNSCLKLTTYALEQITKLGVSAHCNGVSPIVYFKKPSDKLCHNWELAIYHGIAHIVILPHVKKILIDQFVNELKLDIASCEI